MNAHLWRSHFVAGLGSIGLSLVTLDTQGLIELYYNTYNPGLYTRQPLVKTEDLQIETETEMPKDKPEKNKEE